MNDRPIAIRVSRVITPLQDLRDAVVVVRGEHIDAVGLARHVAIPEGAQVLDMGDKIIAPGFMDIHNHGAVGAYAADSAEAVHKIAGYLASTGTTSWLPTVLGRQEIQPVVEAIRQGSPGTDLIGLHLEGPFLAPKRVPGQEAMDNGLEAPSLALFGKLVQACDGHLKLMGVAPELPGALELIRETCRVGVVAAVAHTKASYEQFMRAVEAGVRHVTHAYNVMTGFHHRAPGVMGGVLTCDQVTAELIADGFHVSPPAMDVLIRCKGVDKVAVITDLTPVAGLPDGKYDFFGTSIVKEHGISRVEGSRPDQDHTMAGSEWPLNRDVYNLVDLVGLTLRDAIRMATLTPATVIGMQARKGSIEPGKDADLVVIDEKVNVYLTMVRGRIVFEAKPS